MGTLERALKKLAKAAEADVAAPQAAIAQVATRTDIASSSGTVPDGKSGPDAHHRTLVFDLSELSAAGLLSEENQSLADEFRAIKQPLLKKAKAQAEEGDPHASLIMVTSALAGEGKTFSCVNLSLSLAREKDWEVVLIDVDCKNPQLSRLLGVADEPGLLELLRDPNADLDAFIVPTNIDGLSVLPLGRADEHAAELLASARMRAICERLASQRNHRLTVFDTSPLLLTSESSILAQHAGQILMIVRAGRTPQHAVMAAVGKLDQHKAIGLILNQADEGRAGLPYGGYGQYPYASPGAAAPPE